MTIELTDKQVRVVKDALYNLDDRYSEVRLPAYCRQDQEMFISDMSEIQALLRILERHKDQQQ